MIPDLRNRDNLGSAFPVVSGPAFTYPPPLPRGVAAAFAGRWQPEYIGCEAEAIGKTTGEEKGTSWA